MIQARGGEGLASDRRNKMEEINCGVSENHILYLWSKIWKQNAEGKGFCPVLYSLLSYNLF